MLQRKSLLWPILLGAVVVLLTSTRVRAQEFCSSTNDFNVVFDGTTPLSGGLVQYKYTITAGTKALNKLSLAEFALDKSLTVMTTPTSDCDAVTDHGPGAGGQAEGDPVYGENIPQVKVVTVTPQGSTTSKTVHLCVSGSSAVGDIGWHSKGGNAHDTCITEGPSPSVLPPGTVVTLTEKIDIQGQTLYIQNDPLTGCPRATNPVTTDEAGLIPINADSNFKLLDSFGNLISLKYNQGKGSDPRCPVGRIAGGTATCEWITIGGTPYGPLPSGCTN